MSSKDKNDKLDELCSYVCEWVSDHRGKSPVMVCDDYPSMMKHVLKVRFLMGNKAADEFVKNACEGNWERLHITRLEKALGAEAFTNELLDDLWYVSDRWSWDRVLRIQWLYRRIVWDLRIRGDV